jgi:hypothetical protein
VTGEKIEQERVDSSARIRTRKTRAKKSDSLTGILTTADSVLNIRTTTDGGRHWIIAPFGVANNTQNSLQGYGSIAQSHSYGNGKFRLYKAPYGPIYTTNNNWKTVDSTTVFFDTSQTNPNWYFEYLFIGATFSQIGDTVLAYGVYYYNGAYPGDALIMRSTNGGYSWERPMSSQFHNRMVQLHRSTSFDHSEILVGGLGGNGLTKSDFYLSSTDGGFSWVVDSLMDTVGGSGGYNCVGLTWAAPDNPLSVFL